jgi:hypothetical protein
MEQQQVNETIVWQKNKLMKQPIERMTQHQQVNQ